MPKEPPKNSFQQRIAKAIQNEETVTITRLITEPDEEDEFGIRVSVIDEEFGKLEDSEILPVEKATPDGLAKIIEGLAGEIRRGAERVKTAKANAANVF